jgi:hypothetical protein
MLDRVGGLPFRSLWSDGFGFEPSKMPVTGKWFLSYLNEQGSIPWLTLVLLFSPPLLASARLNNRVVELQSQSQLVESPLKWSQVWFQSLRCRRCLPDASSSLTNKGVTGIDWLKRGISPPYLGHSLVSGSFHLRFSQRLGSASLIASSQLSYQLGLVFLRLVMLVLIILLWLTKSVSVITFVP